MRQDVTRRFFWHVLRLSLRFVREQLRLFIAFVLCLLLVYILNTSRFSQVIKGALQDELSTFDDIISRPAHGLHSLIGLCIDKLYAWHHNIPYQSIEAYIENSVDLQNQKTILLDEITSMKKSLGYAEESSYNFLTARIINSVFGPLGGSFVLAVGSKNCVHSGNAVIKNGNLIGLITKVGEKSAKGLYVGNPNLHIPVVFLPSHKSGVLVGDGKEKVSLTVLYLSRDDWGDQRIAVTSGDGHGIPYGIVVANIDVGKIKQAIQDNDGLVQVVTNNEE